MSRPLEDRPDLVTYREDGEVMVSRKGLAYLCGIEEEEAQAEWERQGKPATFRMPKHWRRQGREIAARLGTDNMAEALYLLAREREAELN